jgi:hypothetical protein
VTSQAQFDANRVNATQSTGPRTEAGKAQSARNSTRHGLASGVLFIEGEDPEIFKLLLADLRAEHAPATPTEEILVDNLARHFWFSRRAAILMAAALDENDLDRFALMLRYHTASDRAFSRTLVDLRNAQKARPQSEIGFVSQSAVSQPAGPQPASPIGFVSQPIHRNGPKIGRNEPCPCGSGLKYKKCCLLKAECPEDARR